jgi:hypothetical protein
MSEFEKMGWKSTDKFEVICDAPYYKKGEFVMLEDDDYSSCPLFKRVSSPSNTNYIYLTDLKLIKEEEKQMSNVNQNLITMDKQYKTRDGNPVRILAVDIKNDIFPVAGAINANGKETFEAFTADGRFFNHEGDTSRKDLFEVSIYDHIKLGDLVIFANNPADSWYLGYFGGVSAYGKPKASTHKSNAVRGYACHWDHCKKITIHENP